jgi:hypothetical protein
MGFEPDEIETTFEGVTGDVTVAVIAFDVLGDPNTFAKLDVRIHVTTSLLLIELVVNVALFVPTLTPFTCH